MINSDNIQKAACRAEVAADVMISSPRTCSRFSRVIEAILIFKDEDCGLVPVVEDGKPIGVVTDRDVALALAAHGNLVDHPIEEIMTTNLVCVTPSTPIQEVLATFSQEAVRRLLVVDSEGILVGVIGWKNVCGEISDQQIGRVVTDVVESPTREYKCFSRLVWHKRPGTSSESSSFPADAVLLESSQRDLRARPTRTPRPSPTPNEAATTCVGLSRIVLDLLVPLANLVGDILIPVGYLVPRPLHVLVGRVGCLGKR